MAKVSNNIINAVEDAKAYNKIVLEDKKSTRYSKNEAKLLLDKSNNELKRITALAEDMKEKSKDKTWVDYFKNLYNYANGEVAKMYEDVKETTNKIYYVSKNAYDTAKYTYDNLGDVKTAVTDLSMSSATVGILNKEAGDILKNIVPFVKEYKPTDSYIKIAKEKINGLIDIAKFGLKKDSKHSSKKSDKKNKSVIYPVTNVIYNKTDFANDKIDEVNKAVTLSKTYVAGKKAVKGLGNLVWGLFNN